MGSVRMYKGAAVPRMPCRARGRVGACRPPRRAPAGQFARLRDARARWPVGAVRVVTRPVVRTQPARCAPVALAAHAPASNYYTRDLATWARTHAQAHNRTSHTLTQAHNESITRRWRLLAAPISAALRMPPPLTRCTRRVPHATATAGKQPPADVVGSDASRHQGTLLRSPREHVPPAHARPGVDRVIVQWRDGDGLEKPATL